MNGAHSGRSAAGRPITGMLGIALVAGALALLAAMLFAPAALAVDAGDLDTRFSFDGRLRTDIGSGREAVRGVAIQGDGKIVAVGAFGTADFALARYNPNGSLDPSFSGDGKQTTDFGGYDEGDGGGAPGRRQDRRGRLERRPAASTMATSRSPATTRTARSTRASPATASRRPTSAAGFDQATAVALQGDGKIVVVGQHADATPAPTSRSPATTRTARSTRASPATASRRPTSGTPTGRTGWRSRATARSSRSAAAWRRHATSPSPATTRTARSTRASPATASRRPTSAGLDGANGVAIQATARSSRSAKRRRRRDDFALARYNPNGSLDTTFSGDGKQTTDFGGIDSAEAVAIQSDGRIVAAGWSNHSGDFDFALARFTPSGAFDSSFSGNGKLLTDFFGEDDAALAVAIQPNGRIVAAGTSGTLGNGPLLYPPGAERFTLTRYHGVADNTPRTVIVSGPSGTTTDSTPTFGFQSTEAGSTFQCAIDNGSFVSCASPHTTAPLADGAPPSACGPSTRPGTSIRPRRRESSPSKRRASSPTAGSASRATPPTSATTSTT